MRTVHNEKCIVWAAALVVSLTLLSSSSLAQSNVSPPKEKTAKATLPRMLDLGRNQCLPCKMMAPVLAELKREYAGIIDIEYINIAENPDVMQKLGLPVRAVPFQIFYDASGKIVKRNYGYMSKEEILQAFKTLGFDRKKPGASVK
jgi:thioredoxin 1